jgi:hypothetical protein
MVATGTSTSPLENNGEVGVRRGNADDLSDPFHRAGLERDMLDTRLSPSMISTAFSAFEMPAATQKPARDPSTPAQ